tara:strand:- start:4370 stop:4558 length:189 start_codon:yes stop_codon:yes gene_type:complete
MHGGNAKIALIPGRLRSTKGVLMEHPAPNVPKLNEGQRNLNQSQATLFRKHFQRLLNFGIMN